MHFEQVPLEVVKEIAEIDAVEKTSEIAGGTVERPPEKGAKSARLPTRSPARKK